MKTLLNNLLMKNNFFTFTISAMIALSVSLSAQPAGTLDPTFADNGKFIMDNGNLDLFTDVEIQNDGKIIAIGITYDAAYVASAQAIRFMPDGTIDQSFGANGIFTYSLNFEANVYGCVIKDNGKILMTGSTTDYNDYRILLIQLNENGTLDAGFGVGGVVVQKIGPDMNFFEDHSYAITLQDDGKILIAGKSYNVDYQFVPVVVRFTENGGLDNTFGTNGVAGIPVIEVENDFDCLLVQEDGKIVASGHYANNFLSFAMLVVRFMPDGTLDATFGNNGIVNYPYQADTEGFAIALTSDNDYLITGFTASADYNFSMFLMKLDQQGELVTAFGDGGIVVADYDQYDIGYSLYIQGDGKILVGGTSGEFLPGDNDMAVWRYHPDGTLDETFGTDGMSQIQFFGNPDEGLAMAHQSDGKIIIAGKARDMNFDYAMVRLTNDFNTAIPENESTNLLLSPNPVAKNSDLRISYKLSASGNVQVKMINSLGIIAAVVELGYQNADDQMSTFTIPSAIEPGVYFIRVHANGYQGTTTKVIVTR
jgi:uncharacterized delta-60 repeat protein